jgi:hypothetical protein
MAGHLPSVLAKIDPADAWAPYTPSAETPWNAKWIAHLYRRAAFGPSPADTQRSLKDGYQSTLSRLLTGEPDAPALLEVLTDPAAI